MAAPWLMLVLAGPAAGAPLFSAAYEVFDIAGEPMAVTMGDLNGDGHPDIVAANDGAYPNYVSSVSVLLGNGDGSFGAARDFRCAPHPISVTIADLNRDGDADVVVASRVT